MKPEVVNLGGKGNPVAKDEERCAIDSLKARRHTCMTLSLRSRLRAGQRVITETPLLSLTMQFHILQSLLGPITKWCVSFHFFSTEANHG